MLVGEIGGNEEEKAAAFIEERMTKPVLAYIAGFSAPPGKTMGHAGAIISGTSGTAQAKKEALEAVGISVGTTPTEVAQLVADRVGSADVISFSRGIPAPECLPVEELAECARAVLLADGRTILSYGSPSGYEPLREWIAQRHGVSVDRVFVTNGGLQGFVFFAQRLAANGERVLVEQPTYDRPLKILREAGAEIVPLAMDEEGLQPEALEQALGVRLEAGVSLHDPDLPEPERPDAVAGAAPADRRARGGARPARARGRPVRPRPLRGDATAVAARPRRRRPCRLRVVLLQDRRPGRPRRLLHPARRAARRARGDVDVHLHHARPDRARRPSTSSSAAAVSSRTSSGSRQLLGARRDAMLESLDAAFGGTSATWSRPEGGYFVWLDVPGTDTVELLGRSTEAGVSFVAGADFGGAPSTARLAYSFVSPDEIREGVPKLAALLPSAAAH